MKRKILTYALLSMIVAGLSGQACAAQETAAKILALSGVRGGLVVHVGCGDGSLTASLRAGDCYVVHGLDKDPGSIETARATIRKRGSYGAVSVERWRGTGLPYADNVVNLLVSQESGLVSREELLRVLAPGGVACVKEGKTWKKTVKPVPGEIDEWTHALHGPDGNAVAADSVVGPPRRIQWVGTPKWDRNHDNLGSISALVSASGRIFYVGDHGSAASIVLPSEWQVVARDAFSGVVLWRRKMGAWVHHQRAFRWGPVHISRRLVAVGDRVYATLSIDGPVEALNAATGETVKTYGGTERADEIVCTGKTLLCAVGKANLKETGFKRGFSKGASIIALHADTGETLWRTNTAQYFPLSLAASGGQVCFKDRDEIVCVSLADGRERWRSAMSAQLAVHTQCRPMGGLSARWNRNAYGSEWFASTLVMHRNLVLYADGRTLTTVSAEDGRKLWDTPCTPTFHAPVDVFVSGDLVWVGTTAHRNGRDFKQGRDPDTGEVKRSFTRRTSGIRVGKGCGHHRCYRNKATERYILWGRNGIRFDHVAKDESVEYSWVRGTCQYGIMPANGLIYAPPHSCACFIESKINGFFALAPASREEAPGITAGGGRLEKGPAYAQVREAAPPADDGGDWPTYRHDPARSGVSRQAVAGDLEEVWKAGPGGRLSAVVVSAGRLYVASVDEHTVHALDATDGRVVWSHTAGGRIDSPPTVWGELLVFGSADGYVRCLRASDGELAWRFRAAPADRRVMSFGRLESVWPVHGSVLVVDGVAFFAAGRSSFLDGGIRMYKLDIRSGRELAGSRFYGIDPKTGVPTGGPMRLALPDILSSDGKGVYMRHVKMDRENLRQVNTSPHLHSAAGFLDDTWYHRAYWFVGTKMGSNYGGWPGAAAAAPSGRIMVVDGSATYGFGRISPRNMAHGAGKAEPHHIFATAPPEAVSPPPEPEKTKKRRFRGRKRLNYRWRRKAPLQVRAMALAGETLFVAGPLGKYGEPGVLEGKNGVVLKAIRAADGEELGEYPLAAVPVFDGMAAAGGRLYVSLRDGTVVCMGASGKGTSAGDE
jgi:outer membrane protein assembly factor BamB